jgi:fimbrial isopeptide formation D2 family protein
MKKRSQIVLAIALVLVLFLVALPAALAQVPPTWMPPEIFKSANHTKLALNDTVRFTIVVRNSGDPENDATWYHVRVTDNIDPALRIDAASTTMGTVTVTGQQVIVDGDITLEAGESFVVTIDCTLIGPIPANRVITNTATLEYTDDQDNPQPPIDVDEPVEIIIEEEVPPVVPEASTLVLLGSAATGLAGYVSLQLRARRRRGS